MYSETSRVNGALQSIRRLLPETWRLESDQSTQADDESFTLRGPGNQRADFAILTQPSGLPIAATMATLRERGRETSIPIVYIADYIGPSLREAIAAEGFSYADATGWVRIEADSPLVLLTSEGAEKAPRDRNTAAITRLNGVAASRIIRALCEIETPIGVRDLAMAAQTSPGSVSKLLPTLTREGIIDRDESARITAVRRRELIYRWTQDYGYETTNRNVGYYLAPRGIDRTLSKILNTPIEATFTGSIAARDLLPSGTVSVVPLRLIALYSKDAESVVDQLSVVETTPESANIVIAEPQDERILTVDMTPIGLTLADLLTLPGRGDAEADQLMDTLARTDVAWKK